MIAITAAIVAALFFPLLVGRGPIFSVCGPKVPMQPSQAGDQ